MATVLITGANRGIGLELARLFSDRGDRVLAVCRSSAPELDALQVDVKAGIDVGEDGCIERLRHAIGDTPLDVLVNNAGILHLDSLDHLDFEMMRRHYEVNALGPLRVTVALRKSLCSGSKLVIITSRVGSMADNSSGGLWGYRMSKAAVNMAAVNLAHELRPSGVAVGLLHPGMVATSMTGQNGIPPAESARSLLTRIDALSMATSGKFLHANGKELPW